MLFNDFQTAAAAKVKGAIDARYWKWSATNE